LDTALVSDFTMPAAPAPARVAAIFADYLNELDRLGLRGFFEPVERHVTLSTHAGVTKPDRHVYEVACRRLCSDARLTDCLSVTENAGHIAACRDLGIQTCSSAPTSRTGPNSLCWCGINSIPPTPTTRCWP